MKVVFLRGIKNMKKEAMAFLSTPMIDPLIERSYLVARLLTPLHNRILISGYLWVRLSFQVAA